MLFGRTGRQVQFRSNSVDPTNPHSQLAREGRKGDRGSENIHLRFLDRHKFSVDQELHPYALTHVS